VTAEAWRQALDALEAQILVGRQLAEGRSAAVPEPWSTPDDLGPLPAELLARAGEVHAQQQALIADLPDFIARVRRQLSLTKKVSDATSSARRPVYIDQTA
jgi:hypothetical protein